MMEHDVEDLINQLDISEKAMLLSGTDLWHTAAIPRLNIPSIRLSDGPNGIRGTSFFNSSPSACFPCGTALGATFDKKLLFEVGEYLAEEAKAKGVSVVLGPTVNIHRGPLNGRGFESFSEDSTLSGLAASYVILGLQSKNVQACIKHFVCNDMEDERNSVSIDVSQRALREVYLMPFQLACKYSNFKSLMTSYNKVNGEHVSQSRILLDNILRKEWEWKGTIISDWFGTYSLKKAIDAGLDLEMPGKPRFRNVNTIQHLVGSKELSESILDERAKNVLKLVKHSWQNTEAENHCELNNDSSCLREALKKFASQSIVLLKNKKKLLPLSRKGTFAVIGPNAKVCNYSGGGSANLKPYYTVSMYDGIAAKIDGVPEYALGCHNYLNLPNIANLLVNPRTGKHGYVAKFYLEPATSENRTLIDDYDLEDGVVRFYDYCNDKMKDGYFYIDIEGYLIPDEDAVYEFGISVFGTALLFIDDVLLIDNKTKQTPTNHTFEFGTIEERNSIYLKKGRKYNVRVEYGSAATYTLSTNLSPSTGGRYSIGCVKVIDPETEIDYAVRVAKSVDCVILCVGLTAEWETEGEDRKTMTLPSLSDKLVYSILQSNPNTVVVTQSGTPIEMPWISEAHTLLHIWYNGNELGNALANIIFGEQNPCGKLPITFPKKLKDNPAYLSFRSSRGHCVYGEDVFVGYKYYEAVEREVLFPFGYGLSYTTFELSNLYLKNCGERLRIDLEISNTGPMSGAEIIQVYISQIVRSVNRPVKELKEFSKVVLCPKETKLIRIELDIKYATSFYDELNEKWCSEEGEYNVLVGTSSKDIALTGKFTLPKTIHWTGL
ncbi:glycosyl hydrolase family 3 [Schizosaccharomyces pombe]|uniref:Putative beta-glucosidase n=1 Tax=Schizosaccharomyces pombe (strain 972 / ATCC 24843) TaxID=284812 RepID=BGLS_SCHPO|nr:putative glycosyl hydrolase family 3 [Schizosaccharomyces pombe]Q9P6J6.1 RecName: Full=Putative beta-glucosidase; AltName: Full=Beta-D-glucoside glucohydrolase; AltName: Full=Cellobiase; AltName: Full=Gentiobiase [Schizosaccharomyces pombe 972h-]CAB91166.1 glycosyl hydrolase family 3 (predicted) [Schizosaccharomyces pombe]|eukprot:NP_595060.1 putative glycosyl hydrolase family 3 [Schizosaccharomyces pombe]